MDMSEVERWQEYVNIRDKRITELEQENERLRVQPEPGVEYLGNPQFMSLGYAKQLLKLVKQGKESVHSPAGGTVWIVQKWARLNGRALHVEIQFDGKGKLMGYICQVTP